MMSLFSIEKNQQKVSKTDNNFKNPNLNYSEHGFEQAKNHSGGLTALKIELNKIYQNYKEEIRQNEEEQNKLKKPKKVKLEGLKSENKELKKRNEKLSEQKIPSIHEEIAKIEKDIRFVKENPETITGDKSSKASFYIGLTIIAFLTLYLLVFYSSASYSAFFKQFSQSNIGVVNSIFDTQAFTKAFYDGFTELVLITAMPFIFLGLGFLIHKFQEEDGIAKYVKITFLLLITFIFDSILAFEITEKIYSIEAANSFQKMPEYTIPYAIENVQFWMIIFAGFVVYIVWGFVFDFMMEAYEKLDKIALAIRNKKNEVKSLKEKKERFNHTIQENARKISVNKTKIDKLEESLRGHVISIKKFEKIYIEFMSGWVHCLNALKLGENKVDESKKIGEKFIENIMDDYQTVNNKYE